MLFLIILLCLFIPVEITAIEIPLEVGAGKGTNLAYVDMKKAFELHPWVERSKHEYIELRTKLDKEIAEKETKLKNLKKEIITLEKSEMPHRVKVTTPAPARLAISTTTYTTESSTGVIEQIHISTRTSQDTDQVNISTIPVKEQLKLKKEELETKQKELIKRKEEIEKELEEFEETKTLTIMADLYQIIQDLAKEEDFAVVVDKSNILYGQPVTDLTRKVEERLRGK